MTAALTLGNKKGVDILVARATGDAATVEVKVSPRNMIGRLIISKARRPIVTTSPS
jgi:hypothetical protein